MRNLCTVIHVDGETEARAFKIPPDSQCVLFDKSMPIVWLCRSDAAGYRTVIPCTLMPCRGLPFHNVEIVPEKVEELERRIKEMEKLHGVD